MAKILVSFNDVIAFNDLGSKILRNRKILQSKSSKVLQKNLPDEPDRNVGNLV